MPQHGRVYAGVAKLKHHAGSAGELLSLEEDGLRELTTLRSNEAGHAMKGNQSARAVVDLMHDGAWSAASPNS